MRSLVLAEEAISRGYECFFVGEILNLEWAAKELSNLAFTKVIGQSQDFISRKETDVLIIDSYSIPLSDSFITRENWRLVMSIRDAITPRYDADIELRPGFKQVASLDHLPMVLSGPEYALIRKGISKVERSRGRHSRLRVVIVGGGSDSLGFTRAITGKLKALKLNLEVHIFSNTNFDDLPVDGFNYHPIGPDLDLIANDIDLALTTASTSSLEFIAREVPTAVACAVENQEDLYRQFGELGYAEKIGYRDSIGNWNFDPFKLVELLKSSARREELRNATRGLIDLRGSSRVIDVLEEKK